ncbi:hypothetical protein CFP56_036679 [Quercus suber]|uniref:Uncharacterized protein n=1 Tax=Quercus suber TaxID=58331 RepID=A0AAW0MAF2_QUESU
MDVEKARKLIENIRRTKFSIGGRKNPLMEDFHQAVKDHSAELYAKDVHYFMELVQKSRQEVIWRFSRRDTLMEWLQDHVKFTLTNVSIVARSMLLPLFTSVVLSFTTGGWYEGYVELAESYLQPGYFAASDIPDISPPNAAIPTVSSSLTKQNAFLLLDWYQNLKLEKINIPNMFLKCMKEGSWLKITTSGFSDYRPPSQSFLLFSSLGKILQNGSVLVDIPLVNLKFYGRAIKNYKEELMKIGVMCEYGEACEFIGEENYLPQDNFINSIKDKRWLRTCCGDRSPVESVLFDEEWKTASHINIIPFIDQGYFGKEIHSFREELKSIGVVIGFNDRYLFIVENLKSPSQALRGVKFFKMNLGYKPPGECFFFDPQWVCILQVFEGFAFIDHDFHGRSIFSYRNELKETGVKVDFEEVVEEFANRFKQEASSVTKEIVLSFLSCCRKLKNTPYLFPSDITKSICGLKRLLTRHGDKRSPRDCILFGPDWQSVFPIADLPFIDNSDNYYGKDIHEYKEELKNMRVVAEFEDGAKLVADGLLIPSDPTSITPVNVLPMLEWQARNYSFPNSFSKEISKKWLKTTDGYRPLDKGLLLDSSWGSYLLRTDGPFIDEDFYGSNITSYKVELKEIGVILDVKEGCSLIASQLDVHFTYNYLSICHWKPDSEVAKRIFIPNVNQNGEWFSSKKCVLHDEDGLFSLQLKVLDKYFEPELLDFFSNAFDVGNYPSVDDYLIFGRFGKVQANHCHMLTVDGEITRWFSDSDGILLSNKHNVFMADDLQLKDIFEKFSSQPLFVWCPQPSMPSLPPTKLLEIYRNTGVRTISESVQKEESSSVDVAELNQVWLCSSLANPVMKMEANSRHETIQRLLNVTFLETGEPITVNYSLSLSSGEIVNARLSQIIRWDEKLQSFLQRSWTAISEGLLWENSDHIGALSELIKLAFILEFGEEAVMLLMKSKNLQIIEDEDFLSSAFPSD